MSKFKDFIQKVIEDIKSLIEAILPTSKHLLDLALAICNNIKSFTDGSTSDIIAALIPGSVDDEILAKIREYLPKILVALRLADAEASKTSDEVVKDGITTIQSMDDNTKSVTLQSVWKLLSDVLTEEDVPLADLQKIAQSYYEEYGKK